MKRYDVSEVEERCFEVIDEIERTGEPVLVTKNGAPYVEMSRIEHEPRLGDDVGEPSQG